VNEFSGEGIDRENTESERWDEKYYFPMYRSKRSNNTLIAKLDDSVKRATCVKLMGYSISNKTAAGIHQSHELPKDDYLILRIKELSGGVASNNSSASGAFAILPTTGKHSSTGALDYSVFDLRNGIVTHEMDPTWLKQLTLEITDRQGKEAQFGRIHLWFKMKVAHG